MPMCPVTILGGLPVIAEVWFSGPDYYGEYDSGVDALYWQKRDGTAGKLLSPTMMERIEKKDQWWQASVTEQASEWLSYRDDPDEPRDPPEKFTFASCPPVPSPI